MVSKTLFFPSLIMIKLDDLREVIAENTNSPMISEHHSMYSEENKYNRRRRKERKDNTLVKSKNTSSKKNLLTEKRKQDQLDLEPSKVMKELKIVLMFE